MAKIDIHLRKIPISIFSVLLSGLVLSFSLVQARDNGQFERTITNWTANGYQEVTVSLQANSGEEQSSLITQSPFVSTSGCVLSKTAMISHWPLDDGPGATTFLDVFGGHDGNCDGDSCPASTSGKVGSAFAFTSGESDSIEVPTSTDFDWLNADSFSIGVWIKTSQDCEGNKVFVGRYRDAQTNPTHGNWWVGCKPIDEEDPENDVGVAVFRLRTAGNTNRQVNGTSQINDGEWHYIVGVRDVTSSSDKNYLYVDGNLEGMLDSPDYGGGNFESDQSITMGSYEDNLTYLYEGILDEVVIYDRAKPEIEIKQYFDACIALSPNIYLPLVTR